MAWQQSVDGVSPEQLALAYQGEHPAKLHWSKNPAAITEPVTLTLDHREQSGASCGALLSVATDFSLRANDGTIIDSGQGSLSVFYGVLERASYSSRGQHFRIVGIFSGAMGEVTVSGALEPLEPAAADSADFSSDSAADSGGGT